MLVADWTKEVFAQAMRIRTCPGGAADSLAVDDSNESIHYIRRNLAKRLVDSHWEKLEQTDE